MPIGICVGMGILVDRWLPLAWTWWLAAGLMIAFAWFWSISRQRESWAGLCVLAMCVALGGARHHLFWSVRQPNDIALFAAEESQLVALRARIVGSPWIQSWQGNRLLSALPRPDRTVCVVQAKHLLAQGSWTPVSGRARLTIDGHALDIMAGDDVEVCGRLAIPRPPGNSGEYDFRDYLRRRAADCVVVAEHPDAVKIQNRPASSRPARGIGRMRNRAESMLVENLSPETTPLALALLLGNRADLNDETRRLFAESGMMHLLAISGLHVGILAALIWTVCQLLRLSAGTTSVVMLTIVIGYSFLADARPPIIRATVFLAIVLCGRPWYRAATTANTIAISALVILFWNPSDLFDPGAQLSFLSVVAIAWIWRLRNRWMAERTPLQRSHSHWWTRGLGSTGFYLRDGYLIVFAIWLFTSPLVAARFQLLSPIGFVLNVFLIPLAVLVLWTGYLLLASGFILPSVVTVFAGALDAGLHGLLAIVEAASSWKLGHVYVPAPPAWWLAGYYGALLGAVAFRRPRTRRNWWWVGLCGWLAVGLSLALLPVRPGVLRCTFLSVGHGCSVLLEMPQGGTVLYDAGSLTDGDRVAEIVRGVLSQRRKIRLDAVIVSHADVDHFNAVPRLLRTLPVGTIVVAQPFLDFEQESVGELCKAAVEASVPLRVVQRGDRLRIDETVEIKVLHPEAGEVGARDNENSLVLAVAFAGRRILLAGDLEGNGLQRLMEGPPLPVDVLLSPHHGSLAANPRELAEWAQPKWVVVSSGRSAPLSELRTVYGEWGHVLSTYDRGAVQFEISPQGTTRCTTRL